MPVKSGLVPLPLLGLTGAFEAWKQTAADRIVNLGEGTGQPCH